MKIAVSYLSSYYSKEKTLSLIEETSADFIHVDLMDGGFVPKKNFCVAEVQELLKNYKKPLDIHLMTFDPILYIDSLSVLKPTYITIHVEATKDVIKTIEVIKKNNIKVGLALKPDTNLLELMPYLNLIDLVLVMSVTPGAGGQEFMMESIKRISDLKVIKKVNNLNFLIAVDGGINENTVGLVKDVDLIVSGSFICKSNNYEKQIKMLRDALEK